MNDWDGCVDFAEPETLQSKPAYPQADLQAIARPSQPLPAATQDLPCCAFPLLPPSPTIRRQHPATPTSVPSDLPLTFVGVALFSAKEAHRFIIFDILVGRFTMATTSRLVQMASWALMFCAISSRSLSPGFQSHQTSIRSTSFRHGSPSLTFPFHLARRHSYVREPLTHWRKGPSFAINAMRILKCTGCRGCPRRSHGDVSSAYSGNWAIPPERARPVQHDRSLTPVVTPMSFHCGNPTRETTSARQCCVSIFANFFSTQMSSCAF